MTERTRARRSRTARLSTAFQWGANVDHKEEFCS